ncbi:peptidase inhibitor family I36 protein [Streptomyces inhibens]|uniref:peptidase inhibitor family I36 protein n=1 Tax=Streptomyces inhibens TaxID=2293571 RepID=UPI001EE76227|nr:peptidase inhibitor family I36 protein [Streptomyces inhibens]UKY49747.1 peptidase inhibitor family I36 protein [Streptomyces inhibens]
MRIRQIAAVVAAAAVLTLGVALPASADGHADVAAAQGRVTKVQVFQDAKYKNRNTTFTEDMWDLSKDGWNNTISSAINWGNRTVTFYSGVKGHGAHFSLAPGDREAHFGNRGMPDTTTSVMFR